MPGLSDGHSQAAPWQLVTLCDDDGDKQDGCLLTVLLPALTRRSGEKHFISSSRIKRSSLLSVLAPNCSESGDVYEEKEETTQKDSTCF
jgi:hypothetical protein